MQPTAPNRLISGYSSTAVNRAKCATACAVRSNHGSCSRTCRSNLSATASEWNVHSFGIQPEPSRPVGTAAEVVERVVRFAARSTTDWCWKGAERSRTDVHKCLSPPEKASRGSRSNERRSYRAGRCARRASPIARRRRWRCLLRGRTRRLRHASRCSECSGASGDTRSTRRNSFRRAARSSGRSGRRVVCADRRVATALGRPARSCASRSSSVS
jgi:hypothetical protein